MGVCSRRKTVFVVWVAEEWGNVVIIDSVWTTRELADKRCAECNGSDSDEYLDWASFEVGEVGLDCVGKKAGYNPWSKEEEKEKPSCETE